MRTGEPECGVSQVITITSTASEILSCSESLPWLVLNYFSFPSALNKLCLVSCQGLIHPLPVKGFCMCAYCTHFVGILLAKDGYPWTILATCHNHSSQHHVFLRLHLHVWITQSVSSPSDTIQAALLGTGHLLPITGTPCKSSAFLPPRWGPSTLSAWWSQSNYCGHSFTGYKTLPHECIDTCNFTQLGSKDAMKNGCSFSK